MRTLALFLPVFTVGCVSEQAFYDLPSPSPAAEREPAEVCPGYRDGLPGVVGTSAVAEVIAHCTVDTSMHLGIYAVDVGPMQVTARAYVVDIDDPDDPGEEHDLDLSSSRTPPRLPRGVCLDVVYWGRVRPVDGEAPSPWELPLSRYACSDLRASSSLTYAFALFDEEDELVDCAVVGAQPSALQARQARGEGPSFPLEGCHDAPFDFAELRE